MFIGTHACLPMVTLATVDVIRIASGRNKILTGKQLLMIGLAGILPDLLWPHTSMQGRLNSWTHNIWFLLFIIPFIIYFSKRVLKGDKWQWVRFSIFFWFAAALHVATDAISGGVNLFYPIQYIVGVRLVPYSLWLYSDIVFIAVFLVLFLIRYLVLGRRKSKEERVKNKELKSKECGVES